MVTKVILERVGVLFPILFFITPLFSQKSVNFSEYNTYTRSGISLNALMFEKAKFSNVQGRSIVTSHAIYSFQVGYMLKFRKTHKWSYLSGIFLTYEPGFNVSLNIEPYDLRNQDSDGLHDKYKTYPEVRSISIPLYIERKFKLFDRIAHHFTAGINLKYLTQGSISGYVTTSNEDLSNSWVIFALEGSTPNNKIQGSALLSSGLYFTSKFALFNLSIQYNVNFQDLYNGEYFIGNLNVTPESRGKYSLSGNYFSLSLTTYIKKPKKKLN